MLTAGKNQAYQNKKPAFGASYQKVEKLLINISEKNAEKDIRARLSYLIKKEINTGEYLEAYKTVKNAYKIAEKNTRKGNIDHGLLIAYNAGIVNARLIYNKAKELHFEKNIGAPITEKAKSLLKELGLFPGHYTKPKSSLGYRLDKLIKGKMQNGQYLEAHNTLVRMLTAAKKQANRGNINNALIMAFDTGAISSKTLYKQANSLYTDYKAGKPISDNANALLKKLGLIKEKKGNKIC